MKLTVAGNLEKDHLAIVLERTVCRKPPDGRLHRLDVCRP
jgi:hypothetical protein